jgi:pseudaminic acid cytidylyltransferase
VKVAIIPARGGSRRIPGKNKRIFSGKPIICYSIEAAMKTRLFDRIIVSTDDAEIADIAMKAGAFAVYRPIEYRADEVGTQDVISNCADLVPSDFVCGIYPTCPLMQPDNIARGFRVLNEREDLHYAMSVGTNPLSDAGQFYWGRTRAFLQRKPLLTAHTAMIPISDQYVCDINTEEDWQRAMAMYVDLQNRVKGSNV